MELIPYGHAMGLAGREPLILLIAAFLLTFALTRLYTRLARIYGWGSASAGGIHLHHMLVGTSPFGIHGGNAGRLIAFVMIAVNVNLAVVTLLKGKVTLGMLAVFVPLVGLVAAARLAKPRSLWSKWFYGERKRARAEHRF